MSVSGARSKHGFCSSKFFCVNCSCNFCYFNMESCVLLNAFAVTLQLIELDPSLAVKPLSQLTTIIFGKRYNIHLFVL